MESPIVIESCDVEFLSAKANNYNETIYYFKLIDTRLQKKMKPLITASKLETDLSYHTGAQTTENT